MTDETTTAVADETSAEVLADRLRQVLVSLRTDASAGAEVLAARLRQGPATLDAGREELHILHAQRQAGTLPRAGYVDYLLLEDLCGLVAQALDASQWAFEVAQALENLGVGVAHWNTFVPMVIAWVNKGVALLGALQAWRAEMVALLDDQQAKLVPLLKPDGRPAFELTGGDMQVQQFLGGLPGGDHWRTVLSPYFHDATTVGKVREAADVVSGTRPFSATLQRTYLEGYRDASHL